MTEELQLHDAEVVLDQQEDDPAIARFQRRAIEAFEPKPASLKVGQKLDVYTPFYRQVEVLKVADTSVIVKASSQVAKSIPALTWREVWAVRQIKLPIILPMDVKWTADQSHLIVIQENRPPTMRAASPLIAIDPKTETSLNEQGELFAPYRSIVEVMPVEEETEARGGGIDPSQPLIWKVEKPETISEEEPETVPDADTLAEHVRFRAPSSREITATPAAEALMKKYWGVCIPVPHKGNKIVRMDVVRYHKAQGEAHAVQERSPEGVSVGESSQDSPAVGETHAEGEEVAPQKETARA